MAADDRLIYRRTPYVPFFAIITAPPTILLFYVAITQAGIVAIFGVLFLLMTVLLLFSRNEVIISPSAGTIERFNGWANLGKREFWGLHEVNRVESCLFPVVSKGNTYLTPAATLIMATGEQIVLKTGTPGRMEAIANDLGVRLGRPVERSIDPDQIGRAD